MKNLWNDDLTKSIADTVSDVLEGKVKKEEMDPTDHVKQKDGGFVVVDANGKEVKSFGKKDEADAYAIKNHDDLMAVKKEVAEPEPKGEKEFKDKHKVKKSGEKEDGTVMKEAEEVTISIDYLFKIDEKLKPGRGKETIDIDYIGDKALTKKVESKFKIKIKQTGSTTADIMGEKKNILSFMQSDAYMMDDGDIKELFPELLEVTDQVVELPEEDKENGYTNTPIEELSDKQKEYQKVFKAAMKKFGVKSPADFKDEAKKKEFFDYIDKNYKSDNETD